MSKDNCRDEFDRTVSTDHVYCDCFDVVASGVCSIFDYLCFAEKHGRLPTLSGGYGGKFFRKVLN